MFRTSRASNPQIFGAVIRQPKFSPRCVDFLLSSNLKWMHYRVALFQTRNPLIFVTLNNTCMHDYLFKVCMALCSVCVKVYLYYSRMTTIFWSLSRGLHVRTALMQRWQLTDSGTLLSLTTNPTANRRFERACDWVMVVPVQGGGVFRCTKSESPSPHPIHDSHGDRQTDAGQRTGHSVVSGIGIGVRAGLLSDVIITTATFSFNRTSVPWRCAQSSDFGFGKLKSARALTIIGELFDLKCFTTSLSSTEW